jgi:hypothetical protein
MVSGVETSACRNGGGSPRDVVNPVSIVQAEVQGRHLVLTIQLIQPHIKDLALIVMFNEARI